MSETLKERTAKGLFWSALNSGTTQVLNLVIGIFLARLLSPEEYGIVGVLAIFTAIAGDLQSSGFTQGLVNIKRPTHRDYNSVFSFNVCMSVMMYALLFLMSPLIASFFHQPCLTEVSRVVFLTFLISSLGIAHGGYMTKNMMNREIAIIGALALIASGTVGITLAIIGFSYWSLAWQQVTYITVMNIGRYYYVREWRPRLTMDFGPVRQMAPFALKILVTKIINTTSSNVLTFIFGRLFPIRAVGNYSQAFKWDTMANSMVGNTVGQIAQTVLVETNAKEDDSANTGTTGSSGKNSDTLAVFRKMIRFTCFLAMPLMMGLALVGREFILLTIGNGWVECVPLLQVLCISGAFMPLYTMYQNLAISSGRSDIFMWLNIGQILLQVVIILLFHGSGILTMVCAYTVMMIVWLLPWHVFTGPLIKYKWWDMFSDVAPFAFASATVMTATHFATSWLQQPWILMPLRIVMATILYYAVMKVARVQMLAECEKFVMKKMRKA